ncbi:MAG: maleylpyruvate isomerase family mycothiol-dependent enzyme [Aquihabitans sp.]
MTASPLGTVGERYRSTRERLQAHLRQLEDAAWNVDVPACPGWRVRDVLAHVYGITEDALAGRISGPPTTEQTALEVDRHRDDDPRDLVEEWSATAPEFEEAISAFELWPAFIDVLSHEHDIRGALGDRSFRDHDDVVALAGLLTDQLPSGIEIVLTGQDRVDPAPGTARLTASAFEILRVRLGRRSLDQVRAMDWSIDPGPAISGLFVFGPRTDDLIE